MSQSKENFVIFPHSKEGGLSSRAEEGPVAGHVIAIIVSFSDMRAREGAKIPKQLSRVGGWSSGLVIPDLLHSFLFLE